MEGQAAERVQAVRVGPVRFMLAAERITLGMRCTTGDQVYEVVSDPVTVGTGTYLTSVLLVGNPAGDRHLTVQLQIGRQVRGPNS